jgi:hypothetical protein
MISTYIAQVDEHIQDADQSYCYNDTSLEVLSWSINLAEHLLVSVTCAMITCSTMTYVVCLIVAAVGVQNSQYALCITIDIGSRI